MSVADEPAAEQTKFAPVFAVLNLTTSAAAAILPFFYYSRSALVAFAIAYTVCGLGLTAGYHRLLAHHSYTVPKWLEHVLAICGYLAIQRGPIFWASMHRLHHKYTDIPGKDPHTPREGIFHVHFGWLQERRREIWDPALYRRRTTDLNADSLYLWMDRESHDYLTFAGLCSVAFTAGGFIGAADGGFDLHNAFCFLVWVGLLNRVALLQAFGLINSVCHLFGSRPFRTRETNRSTNNLFVALIIFGEGWHNNHHAFPHSARHGLHWYQPDVAWWTIALLRKLGLAHDVHVPSKAAISMRTQNPELD